LLLKAEELSVAELQEILAWAKAPSPRTFRSSSRRNSSKIAAPARAISTVLRLAPLWGAAFGRDSRPSQNEIPEFAPDQAAMRRVLRKRQDKMRAFFDSVAGRLGKDYVPGKSWKSLAERLLRLMPPLVIADLGAGEGASAPARTAGEKSDRRRQLSAE
jgi:hypothetical protein